MYLSILDLVWMTAFFWMLGIYILTHVPNRLTPTPNLREARGQSRQQNKLAAQMKRQTAAQIRPLARTKEEAREVTDLLS